MHVVPAQDTRVISMRMLPERGWSMNPGPDDPLPIISGDQEVFAPTLNILQQHVQAVPAENN